MKSMQFAAAFAAVAVSALAGTDCWTYLPPEKGKTRGSISWTDSSGFENVIKGIVLADGQIRVYPNENRNSTTLKNADFSIPVKTEDGTELEYSPDFLAGKDRTDAAVLGYIPGITNIVVNANATSIGRYCFKSCTGVVKVRLPDGLLTIGKEAFYGDAAIVEIENFLPDSVTTVGETAFRDCKAVAGSLTARGLESVGPRAFHTMSALQSVDLSEAPLVDLSIFCFYDAKALESVALPEGLKTIGAGCFMNDTALRTVTPLLPPTLETLGTDGDVAFGGDPIEGHVLCPPTLSRVGTRAFRNSRVETFTASKKGLKSIGQFAFYGNPNLTNVVLSAEIETIAMEWLSASGTSGVEQHVWFRNLPTGLSSDLWKGTKKQNIMVHLPWSRRDAWREWVASGPAGHTFTFNKATKTLPEKIDEVGTWLSTVTQNVTWWKDVDAPTVVVVR